MNLTEIFYSRSLQACHPDGRLRFVPMVAGHPPHAVHPAGRPTLQLSRHRSGNVRLSPQQAPVGHHGRGHRGAALSNGLRPHCGWQRDPERPGTVHDRVP